MVLMNIAYIIHTRFPTERAHGFQMAQVADALTQLGHKVDVLAPSTKNYIDQSLCEYYGISSDVELKRLKHFDPWKLTFVPESLRFFGTVFLYGWALKQHMQSNSYDIAYIRSPYFIPSLLQTSVPIVLELHSLPSKQKVKFAKLFCRCKKIICLTSSMASEVKSWGVPAEKIIIEGDAVDTDMFTNVPSKEESKKQFDLPLDSTVISYIGRLKTMGQEKGVADLLLAIAILRQQKKDVHAFIVGGPRADMQGYLQLAQDLSIQEFVTFTGQIPASQVPIANAASDVVTMPFPDLPHYRNNMSPLKMFEYMAAHRPIVTSDLPTIRDVLDEKTAYFCKPGDAEHLAHVLGSILKNPAEAQKIADASFALVQNYTWKKRMERVMANVLL